MTGDDTGREARLAVLRREMRRLRALRGEAESARNEAMTETRSLLREGRALGLGPTELGVLAGLSRQTVTDVLREVEREATT